MTPLQKWLSEVKGRLDKHVSKKGYLYRENEAVFTNQAPTDLTKAVRIIKSLIVRGSYGIADKDWLTNLANKIAAMTSDEIWNEVQPKKD